VIALGTLCKVVDQEIVIQRLLPLYDAFVRDDTWHIRRACCTVLASFVSPLPVEMKAQKVEEIYNLYSVDASRSVRHSIMEVLGEVIAGFEQNNVPDTLLSHFLDMGQQPMNEHELAVMCAFSFPGKGQALSLQCLPANNVDGIKCLVLTWQTLFLYSSRE